MIGTCFPDLVVTTVVGTLFELIHEIDEAIAELAWTFFPVPATIKDNGIERRVKRIEVLLVVFLLPHKFESCFIVGGCQS